LAENLSFATLAQGCSYPKTRVLAYDAERERERKRKRESDM
jgi:hypothetical protein